MKERKKKNCVNVKKENRKTPPLSLHLQHNMRIPATTYTHEDHTHASGSANNCRANGGWEGSWRTNTAQRQDLPSTTGTPTPAPRFRLPWEKPRPHAPASLTRNSTHSLRPSRGRRRLHYWQSTPHVGLPSSHDPSLCCPSSRRAPLLRTHPIHFHHGPPYSWIDTPSITTAPPILG